MAHELVANRYRLDSLLGSGGMSEVWLAEDVELGRRVALKLLARDADPARFEREAHVVAALTHPNICRLYDYGEARGRPYMVLEFLPGGTLEERLVPGQPYPDDETERLAGELAAGLEHAHARGLVHRDLKPGNVLFDEEGRAKIADFGIARMRGERTLTETGTLLGTAAYISPEQAQAEPATPASDVYSFGVILYRLLCGRLPFESQSAVELARMHIHEQPPPLTRVRPSAPPRLAAVAETALAKDPALRPPDGEALVDALASAGSAIEAPTAIMPGSRRPRRRLGPIPVPVAAAVIALLVIAVAGALAAVFIGGSNTADTATNAPPPSNRRHGTTTPAAVSSVPTHKATTARTRTSATTAAPPPTPPPPTPPPPPPTPPPTPPPPPPPTTLPVSVTIPTITPPPPPPPPSP